MSDDASFSRRRLLVLAAASASLSACGSLTVTTDGGGDDATGDVSDDASGGDASDDAADGSCVGTPGTLVGPVSQFAPGSLVAPRTGSIIVGHDAGGLYAFSSICTHQGCAVRVSGSGLRCPCHGATFDANGGSPTSPASRPLVHYALNVCGGSVYVDRAQTVPASTRTPA